MKKLIALTVLTCSLALAGPLRLVTYPVVHPVRTFHGLFQGIKAILW